MASTRKKATKDGQVFYEIRVSRGRGKSYLTTRWYPPEGWSQKAIDRALAKEAAEFEHRCRDGEVVSRAEQKESDLKQKREAAKIQTLRQYGEAVFMPAKSVTMSENGRCAYQGSLNHWIYPALGDLRMPDITPANISALLLSMQSKGKAHATCVKVYTILHSLFKMAYMGDVVTINPMDKVERPKPRKGELKDRDVEAYTTEEVQRIFAAFIVLIKKMQAKNHFSAKDFGIHHYDSFHKLAGKRIVILCELRPPLLRPHLHFPLPGHLEPVFTSVERFQDGYFTALSRKKPEIHQDLCFLPYRTAKSLAHSAFPGYEYRF